VWFALGPASAGAEEVLALEAPPPAPIETAPEAESALPSTPGEEAPPPGGEDALFDPAPASPPEPARPEALPLVAPSLERAWSAPAASPAERADRVRAAADALGVADVEPAARAFLIAAAPGSARERAAAAVRVAPGLPAAWLALASAEWREGGGANAALAAAARGLGALRLHFASRLWLEATGLSLLFAAGLGAGLAWIAARGALAARDAAHDLSDRLDPTLPGFARAGLVAALVLAPVALGEGLVGAALALFALAWWAAEAPQRRALGAAALLVVLALGPLAALAGRALGALPADPVVLAAVAAESGMIDPVDAARLERAASTGDPLAVQAQARRARRAGDLGRAAALLAPLVEADDAGAVVLNDAAHVALLGGDTAGAIALYRRALERGPSAELWFNLAQAHVRAIDMEAHADALDAAQAADARRTRELTRRLAESDDALVDLPLPAGPLRARLRAAADPAVAAAWRATAAPGRLGRAPWLLPLLFAAAAGLASAISRGAVPSRACLDCGERLCPRCGTGDPAEGVCAPCARRRLEARHGGPWERAEGAAGRAGLVRRAGRIAAWLLPGLAERAPARPGLALAALAALAAAASLAAGRAGGVPDPAAVGSSGPLALAALASTLVGVWLGLALGSRRARA
jgi:hypothetical protein